MSFGWLARDIWDLGKGDRAMAQRRGSGKTLKRGSGKTLKRGSGRALRIFTVIMFLACIVASIGIGWLTTREDLEAAQTAGESLKAENEQYASYLEETNRQAKIANEQVILANVTIEKLEQKLAESEKFGAYWWERAHPKEFKSVDELKAWLAQDDTDNTLYIFGVGCISNYDCDDYAVALVRNALSDGYLVSLQIERDHVLNSTIIGNKIYFIEPQTDEVWFWEYRDRQINWCSRG
jgi:preprotein translocase subunit SecG